MAHPFAQVDVFAGSPLGGNPVAVVLGADDLGEEQMAELARWTNLSETTFVLEPTVAGADYRVRIFTPSSELPFAGHPTLGTCHAWLDHTGGSGAPALIRQECVAGLVEVRRDGDRLAFAAPPLLRYEPADEVTTARAAAALGVEPSAIVAAQWVDNGPGWVAVLLDSVDRVLALEPGPSDLFVGVAALGAEGGDAALEVRAFFPAGGSLREDPVTGSLNASLAHWLIDSGRLRAPYVARQGRRAGADGVVSIDRDEDGTIWVGGATRTVVEGRVALG